MIFSLILRVLFSRVPLNHRVLRFLLGNQTEQTRAEAVPAQHFLAPHRRRTVGESDTCAFISWNNFVHDFRKFFSLVFLLFGSGMQNRQSFPVLCQSEIQPGIRRFKGACAGDCKSAHKKAPYPWIPPWFLCFWLLLLYHKKE